MADDPKDITAHSLAATAFEAAFRRCLPIDREGKLVNALVAYVENDPGSSGSRRSATPSVSESARCSARSDGAVGLRRSG